MDLHRQASLRDTVERLEWRLKEAGTEAARLGTELQAVRGDKMEANMRLDEVNKQMVEVRAKLLDAEHVHKQLQMVMAERDGLQDQLRQARNDKVQGGEWGRGAGRGGGEGEGGGGGQRGEWG